MDEDDIPGYLYDMCKEWIEFHEITCAETIFQRDDMTLESMNFAKEICDLIGYCKLTDDNIYDTTPCDVEPKDENIMNFEDLPPKVIRAFDSALELFDLEKAVKVYAFLNWRWCYNKETPGADDIITTLAKLTTYTYKTHKQNPEKLLEYTYASTGGLRVDLFWDQEKRTYNIHMAFEAASGTSYV